MGVAPTTSHSPVQSPALGKGGPPVFDPEMQSKRCLQGEMLRTAHEKPQVTPSRGCWVDSPCGTFQAHCPAGERAWDLHLLPELLQSRQSQGSRVNQGPRH